jgi:hypothetical protein
MLLQAIRFHGKLINFLRLMGDVCEIIKAKFIIYEGIAVPAYPNECGL